MKKFDGLMLYTFFLLIAFWVVSFNQAFGQENSYSDRGRPPSVYSLCCCKKDGQVQEEIFYTCELLETEACPDETKKYPADAINCPSSLIIKKYKG